MACMYPQQPRPETNSEAERTLYDALAHSLPDDYTVFHSMRWLARDTHRSAEDGEADFLIVHPKRGMIVLEVKGGRISYDGPRGRRYSNQTEIKDPFAQARANKYSLIDKLRTIPEWHDRRLAIGHAVAFPDGMVEGNLPPDAPRDIILDSTDLGQLRRWVAQALAFYTADGQQGDGIGSDGVHLLADIFYPSLEVRRPLATIMAEEAVEMLRLTEEQFDLLHFLTYQRRVAIAGCAGSGKTMLAIEQARRLGEQGFQVLLTCHNKLLVEYLRHNLKPPPANTIESFHALCWRLARGAGVLPPRQPRRDYFRDDLPQALTDAIAILGPQYDAIIVDEGQDFWQHWWPPLQALLRDPDRGILYVFYDDNQNLLRAEQCLPPGLQPFPLPHNCRNTRHIHETVLRFYRAADSPTAIGPEGREPQVIYYGSAGMLRQSLAGILHNLVDQENVATKDIVILTCYSLKHSDLWARREIGGFRLTRDDPGPGEVLLSSIHRFKGLERKVVILAEFQAYGLESARRQLYVACSRASNHLIILAPNSLHRLLRSRLSGPRTKRRSSRSARAGE